MGDWWWRVRRWCCSRAVRSSRQALRASPAQATAPAIAAAPQRERRPSSRRSPRYAAQAADAAAKAAKVQQLINRRRPPIAAAWTTIAPEGWKPRGSDFDSAVDLMLTSGMDLKTDPQLSDEFDHLLNAINSLEMSALKQGNGFSPSPSRPRRSMQRTKSPSRPTPR